MKNIINLLLVYSVLVAQIFLISCLILYLFEDTRKKVQEFLFKSGLWLAFLVALVAMSGSLFYSEIIGYVPCKLCWYQRIFMYPQFFLLGLALIRKEKTVLIYSFSLLITGSLISLYHNYIYYTSRLSCGIDGSTCTQKYNLELGFMSIPLMALTAFVLIGFLLYIYNKNYQIKDN